MPQQSKYLTLEEAKKAVRALNIVDRTEYVARHHEDPALFARPDVAYEYEWEGWDDFCGKWDMERYPPPEGAVEIDAGYVRVGNEVWSMAKGYWKKMTKVKHTMGRWAIKIGTRTVYLDRWKE